MLHLWKMWIYLDAYSGYNTSPNRDQPIPWVSSLPVDANPAPKLPKRVWWPWLQHKIRFSILTPDQSRIINEMNRILTNFTWWNGWGELPQSPFLSLFSGSLPIQHKSQQFQANFNQIKSSLLWRTKKKKKILTFSLLNFGWWKVQIFTSTRNPSLDSSSYTTENEGKELKWK